MKKLPVASQLNNYWYGVLMDVYAAHNSSMGLSERDKYSAAYIVKVELNEQKNCLEVHYESGDWWHYTPSGSWY